MPTDASPRTRRGAAAGLKARDGLTLPDFVGIGAMRSGSTWLHTQLLLHPDVFVNPDRKELHYFDKHHDEGLEWYASWFPAPAEAGAYAAIGEVTPSYLATPEAAARIHDALGDVRLVAILRNPVDRAFSQYTTEIARFEPDETFFEFLEQRPDAIERGAYGAQLAPFFERWPEEKILILIAEEAFADPATAFERLGAFLGVDPSGFDPGVARKRVNRSFRRRLPWLYTPVQRARRWLNQRGSYGLQRTAKRLGISRLYRKLFVALGPREPLPTITPEERRRCLEFYRGDLLRLETFLGRPLDVWTDA